MEILLPNENEDNMQQNWNLVQVKLEYKIEAQIANLVSQERIGSFENIKVRQNRSPAKKRVRTFIE